uniref:Uncharacterized protein n=1 Tax=Oryza glumipatula TaxID=40148 RepID=A0A0D9Y8E1_9ORYZ
MRVLWRRAWVWQKGSGGSASFAGPSLDLTPFRPQLLSSYLAGTVAKGTVAKGVGVAKGVQRLGWLRGPQLGLNSFSPPALVAVPCRYCGEGCGCGESGPEPLSPFLAGTVVKGVGVAKGVQRLGWLRGPQLGLNSFWPPALDAVPCWYCGERGWASFTAPSMDLTPFRPQSLTPYLAGTVGKVCVCGERGPEAGLASWPLASLVTVPCGCGERGLEAGLAPRPPNLDFTLFRPQPLSSYLVGTVAKGVGVAKGVQRLGWLHGPQFALNSFSPPALVAVPCGYCGERRGYGERGTIAKGVGVAKGVQRLGWLRGPQLGLNCCSPSALVAVPCRYCGEGRGCGERGSEDRAASTPPSLEATHLCPQPFSPYLVGTVAKGVEAGLASWTPSLDLTPFRPQPLSPYLAGTVAKGVCVAKGYRGWAGSAAPQLGSNSFSPPVLVAVPYRNCGEGRGCGERGPEARAASRPPSLEATHFRPPALVTVPCGGTEARLASRPPSLEATHFRPQPLSPAWVWRKGSRGWAGFAAPQLGFNSFSPPTLVVGTVAKGGGVAKGVHRQGPPAYKQLIFAPALVAIPCGYCGEGC